MQQRRAVVLSRRQQRVRLRHDAEYDAFLTSMFSSSSSSRTVKQEVDSGGAEELCNVIDDMQGFKDRNGDIPRYISRKHILEELTKALYAKVKE